MYRCTCTSCGPSGQLVMQRTRERHLANAEIRATRRRAYGEITNRHKSRTSTTSRPTVHGDKLSIPLFKMFRTRIPPHLEHSSTNPSSASSSAVANSDPFTTFALSPTSTRHQHDNALLQSPISDQDFHLTEDNTGRSAPDSPLRSRDAHVQPEESLDDAVRLEKQHRLEEAQGFEYEITVASQRSFEPVIDDNWELIEEPDDLSCDDPPSGLIDVPSLGPPQSTTSITSTISTSTSATASSHCMNPYPLDFGTIQSDEDVPDPFAHPCVTLSHVVSENQMNNPIYIVKLLVCWLHVQYHLAFRACGVILITLAIVLKAAGVRDEMHSTLTSVLNNMGVEPVFDIWPVCPNCLEVHPLSSTESDSRARCKRCNTHLYDTSPTAAQRRKGQTERKDARPLLQFPTKPLEEHLASLLMVPGLEDELEQWRQKTRTQGEYRDIFDGEVCREVLGPDGLPFFGHNLSELQGPHGELRLGVTLGADWFVL